MLLEMDCVVNSLHDFEIGRTDDEMVIFCKAKRPLDVMLSELEADLGRFGLRVSVLAKKLDERGNVLKIEMINTGSW